MDEELDKEQPKLTSRQHRLKDFLKDNFVPGKYFSIEELVENVRYSDGTPCYTLNTSPKCHHKCLALWSDIREINWNMRDGWKIIIKDKHGGSKLAETKEEFMEWFEEENRLVERKYQYLNNLKSKAEKDGTIPLWNQAMNENKDNTPIESFINGVKVYTRVLVGTKKKELYIITARKIKYDYYGSTCFAICTFADGSVKSIAGIDEKTYSFDTFDFNSSYYKDFSKIYLK